MLEHTSTFNTLYLLDSFRTFLNLFSFSAKPSCAATCLLHSSHPLPVLVFGLGSQPSLMHRPEEVALNAVHRRSPLGEPARLLKSYGCGQTKKVFRAAGLHTVQLAVCCLQEGFDGFAVLRIGDHTHAHGKRRRLSIRR